MCWRQEEAEPDTGPGFVSYDTEKEAQEGAPQRVWILAGGGSVERHTSLAAGLNVWHQLRKQRDIKVWAACMQDASQQVCQLCKAILRPDSVPSIMSRALHWA